MREPIPDRPESWIWGRVGGQSRFRSSCREAKWAQSNSLWPASSDAALYNLPTSNTITGSAGWIVTSTGPKAEVLAWELPLFSTTVGCAAPFFGHVT